MTLIRGDVNDYQEHKNLSKLAQKENHPTQEKGTSDMSLQKKRLEKIA